MCADNLPAEDIHNELQKFKRENKALRKENERISQKNFLLEALLDNLPFAVQIFDEEGYSFLMNEQHRAVLGLADKNSGVGEFNVLSDPFSVEHGAADIYRKIYDGEDKLTREMVYDFDNDEKWGTVGGKKFFRETLVAIKDPDRNVKFVAAVVEDLTRHKNTLDDLRVSIDKFKGIFDNVVSGIAFGDLDGNIVLTNSAFNKLVEYPEEELIGMSFGVLTHPEDLEREFQLISKLGKGEIKNYRLEKRYITKSDKVIWIDLSVSAITDDSGNPVSYVAMVHDISQRMEIEKELRYSEEKYEAVFNTVIEGIIVHDKEGRIVAANKSAERLLGLSEKEILNQKMYDREREVLHDNGTKFGYQDHPAYKTLQTGEPQSDVIMGIRTADGNFRWLSINSQPLFFDYFNEPAGVVVSFFDITEQRKASKRLSDFNHTKDKFFSIIAHDLRSPFTSITGLAEAINDLAETRGDIEIADMAGVLHKVSRQTNQLLHNLLDWARSQSRSIKMKPVNLNAAALISRELELLKGVADRKHIRITAHTDNDLTIEADQDMLSVVIRNLISNAIKYTETNGEITITAALKKEGEFEFRIKDSGVGIEKENMGKLFKLDSEFTTPGTDNELGTGLGLLLCREFIERHHGELSAESEKGIGSEFRFVIPVEQPE